jgi:hypothetical protein
MIDLFDLKMRKQGLAKRRSRMLETRRRDLGAGATLVLQHGDPGIKSGSSLPQVTIYRLTVQEAEVVTLALLKDLDEQITAMSNEIERAALSVYPRKLTGGAPAADRCVVSPTSSESYGYLMESAKTPEG